MRIIKIIYFFLGTISLGLGFLGVFLPGLPTTPFVLLATWFYLRSSQRLYAKVVKSKLFGPFIENYRTKKGIPVGLKIYSIAIMWIMIGVSCLFVVPFGVFTFVLILLGIIGTGVKLFVIPTRKNDKTQESEPREPL